MFDMLPVRVDHNTVVCDLSISCCSGETSYLSDRIYRRNASYLRPVARLNFRESQPCTALPLGMMVVKAEHRRGKGVEAGTDEGRLDKISVVREPPCGVDILWVFEGTDWVPQESMRG